MTTNSGNMPYIKTEPEDFGIGSNNFMGSASNNYTHFNQHHNANGIDPSELSVENGNFGMQYGFGSQNMSSSFNMGNSGYGDEELMESLNFANGQGIIDDYSSMPQPNGRHGSASIPANNQGQMSNVYSNTPEGHPIQSPFLGTFDFNQFRPMNSLQQHMSPRQNPPIKRPSLQTNNRRSSEQRSPMTPRTAAMAGLHIGTPDSVNIQNGRAIRTPSMQNTRHSKGMSTQYDSTPGSFPSYLDSPLSSPSNAMQHAGISETIGGKHASLPAKVENVGATQNLETMEAKKKRRRASHNAVERRRRDNINERIHDLSHLVPQHRLEDDKVRKQLANQSPLSPIVGATSMSPPSNAATSLLAGANGRRAASTAGNITLGLPIEEKEKGPNKGDILNGSVSWTRDLMWSLHQKYVQEEELAQYITQLGGTWPFQVSDEDKRMKTELMDAMEKNDPSSFQYSRADGTGLRVPKHTTVSGEKLQGNSSSSPPSNFELSPGFHSGGSGANSGSNAGQTQYWHSAGHTGISFKEEDEFMEMT